MSESLNRVFDKLKDPNITDIDLVVDAGITTIAQRVSDFNSKSPTEEQWDEMLKKDKWFDGWKISDSGRNQKWYSIAMKFDSFCKNTRQDCMFLTDSPRSFCLQGNEKIVRSTADENTIEKNIVPNLKYLNSINSSYSAGYCNWIQVADERSGDFFWCPPSIKAAGVYIYTDTYFHTWDAPAGLNHGQILNCVDTAFSPYNDEAAKIYLQSWNYATNYPMDGIILEGQKTFQRA